jgi:hypothetical protein
MTDQERFTVLFAETPGVVFDFHPDGTLRDVSIAH